MTDPTAKSFHERFEPGAVSSSYGISEKTFRVSVAASAKRQADAAERQAAAVERIADLLCGNEGRMNMVDYLGEVLTTLREK